MTDLNYNIRAVIFDLGGVLLRTENPQPRLDLAKRYGLTRNDLEKLVFASEISLQAEVGAVAPQAVWNHVQKILRIADDEMPAFQDAFWAGDRLDGDLLRFVNSLRGSYRTVLLSNAWADMPKNIAQRFGKLDAFEMQVFSAEVGVRKPAPEIFHMVLDLLGADPEEAVFVDDFNENILAARKLGLRTILFTSAHQTRQDLVTLLGMESS
ncbi:MAG TPA: HAD family phosphatase [Longilinea sp.]|nr:HAD family phosphatase [Longilinea sp.]